MRSICLLLLLAGLWTSFLNAQKLFTSTFSTEQGLPQQQALSIAQDSSGFIWVGTNGGGAAYYNGFEWISIGEERGLTSALIYSLATDKKRVYLGSDQGLFIYENDSCFNVSLVDTVQTSLFSLKFKGNRLFASTNKGMCELIDDTLRPLLFNHLIDSTAIINFDFNQDEWCFQTLGKGCFQYKNESWKSYDQTKGGSKYAYVSHQWNGDFTIGTHHGLFRRTELDSLIKIDLYQGLILKIYDIFQDEDETFYGTNKGLIRVTQQDTFLYDVENGLSDNLIWKVFKDDQGQIWTVSKNEGVTCIHHFDLVKYQTSLADQVIIYGAQVWEGELWLATSKGLFVKTKKGLERRFEDRLIDTGDMISLSVFKGNLMIGLNNNGIIRLKRNGEFKLIKGISKSIQRIYQQINWKDSLLIMATPEGLVTLQNDKIQPFEALWNKKIAYDLTVIQNQVWIGYEEGLLAYSLSKGLLDKYLDGVQVHEVKEFNGVIYAATEKGVYRKNGNEFEPIFGIPSTLVYSIEVDDKGIWTALSTSLGYFSFEDGKFKVYHASDGLYGINAIYGGLSFQDGLHLLSDNSYFDFNDAWINRKTHFPDVAIKEIYAGDRLIAKNGEQLWDDMISHNNNNLLVRFSYVDLLPYRPMEIQYSLNDGGWRILRNVTYLQLNNLKPGDYNLQVRTCSESGECNVSKSFQFSIALPFWKSWWFIGLWIVIFLAGVYSYLSIRKANQEILEKNKIIQEKNNDILSSIAYAQRIQNSILPHSKEIQESVGNNFVLFKPKDIVSGDFYWLKEKENQVLWSVVDCTGHGVPGAFVSMVGYSGLNRSVNEFGLIEPSSILDKLNELVISSFNRGGDASVRDGMDLALCLMDRNTGELKYAGANNPIYIVRKGNEPLINNGVEVKVNMEVGEFHLYEVKGDKQPIGLYEDRKSFKQHHFQLLKGDRIYIFTDGYADQFGGPKGKKLKYKPFKKHIMESQSLSMTDQKETMNRVFEDWKKDNEQVDDVCLWGVEY